MSMPEGVVNRMVAKRTQVPTVISFPLGFRVANDTLE
jgi:hypothetical protein